MTDKAHSYSIAEIREMLQRFDHTGLVALCQNLGNEFPELCRNVGLGRSLREDEIINMILDFFRRYNNFARLVAAIRSRQSPPGTPKESVAQVTILLEGDFGKFTTTERDSFIFALSRLVGVSPEQIHILRVAPASILITLEMPEQAAQKLVSMHSANDPALRALHIKKVDLVNPELRPIWQQRLKDLADNIAQALDLLKQYEDALLYADEPRHRAKCTREIGQLRESVACYRQEYDELRSQVTGEPPVAMRESARQLEQINTELEMVGPRQGLLGHYSEDEKQVVGASVQQLDQAQLASVQAVLSMLEAGLVSNDEVNQVLSVARQELDALPQHAADSIDRQAVADAISRMVDVKHKLRLTLPIIPVLLSYQADLGLASETDLAALWRQLVARVQSPPSRCVARVVSWIRMARDLPVAAKVMIVAVLLAVVLLGTFGQPVIEWWIATFSDTLMTTPAESLSEASVDFIVTSASDVREIAADGTLALAPGDTVLIKVSVTVDDLPFPRDLTYQYFPPPRGSIPEEFTEELSGRPDASYTAPEETGKDTISVRIRDQETGDEIVRNIHVEVEEQSP